MSPLQSYRYALVALAALVLLGPPAPAQTARRQRSSPGLVLETGARHATCDVLTFTPDGARLLAVGDDKVVRSWTMQARRFADPRSVNLRWPIYREQRGCIFALALSSDAKRVAIG